MLPFNTRDDTYHRQILKRPRLLDILQCFLQVRQLRINLALGSLSIQHSLGLKRLDRLQLLRNVDSNGLERLERALDVFDDGLVFQCRAIVREIDILRLGLEEIDLATGVFIALLEGEEGGGSLALEAEGGGDFDPLDFEGSASLQGGGRVVSERRGQLGI